MRTSVVLVAGGEGRRFGRPKAFVTLNGRTLLEQAFSTLGQLDFVDEVVVVCRAEDKEQVDRLVMADRHPTSRVAKVVIGGDQRFQSVRIGFEVSTGDSVIVHNVANPMATADDFRQVMMALDEVDTAFCGRPVVDTLRRVSEDKRIQTFDRTDVWMAQTPQAFRREALAKLYESDRWRGVTDEIQGTEALGFSVGPVVTGRENIKVTTEEDVEFLERLMGGTSGQTLVGIGDDSHRFADRPPSPLKGEHLVLGGHDIEECPTLDGHSDADVILHALFNAMASALGHGSIGGVADRMVEEGIVDSAKFLTVPFEWMKKRGVRFHNIAISLECARPKIDPLVADIKKCLSDICGVDPGMIGITATSGEGLTAFGKGEGIRCSVAVSLKNTP